MVVLCLILHHDHHGLRESLLSQSRLRFILTVLLNILLRVGPGPPLCIPLGSEGESTTRVGSVEGEVGRAGGVGECGVEEGLKWDYEADESATIMD